MIYNKRFLTQSLISGGAAIALLYAAWYGTGTVIKNKIIARYEATKESLDPYRIFLPSYVVKEELVLSGFPIHWRFSLPARPMADNALAHHPFFAPLGKLLDTIKVQENSKASLVVSWRSFWGDHPVWFDGNLICDVENPMLLSLSPEVNIHAFMEASEKGVSHHGIDVSAKEKKGQTALLHLFFNLAPQKSTEGKKITADINFEGLKNIWNSKSLLFKIPFVDKMFPIKIASHHTISYPKTCPDAVVWHSSPEAKTCFPTRFVHDGELTIAGRALPYHLDGHLEDNPHDKETPFKGHINLSIPKTDLEPMLDFLGLPATIMQGIAPFLLFKDTEHKNLNLTVQWDQGLYVNQLPVDKTIDKLIPSFIPLKAHAIGPYFIQLLKFFFFSS